ncbi:hypothetical protein QOT17_012036 [Balamuthia mandrillaris]
MTVFVAYLRTTLLLVIWDNSPCSAAAANSTAQLAALAVERCPNDRRMLTEAQSDVCCLPPVDDEEEEEESEHEQMRARSHDSTAVLGVRMAAFTPLGMDLGWLERVGVAGSAPPQQRVQMQQNDSPYRPPATAPVLQQRAFVKIPSGSKKEASSSNEEPEEDSPPRRQQHQQQQFELIADQQGIPICEWCSVALQLMDGAVKKVTDSDNDLFFTQSWATCSAIMANYFEENNEAKVLSALYSLEMGKNESVMEFIPRFRAVIPHNYTEHQQIQAFILKLPVNLQHSLNLRQLTIFSQAVRIAKELEAPLRYSKQKVIGVLTASASVNQDGDGGQQKDVDFLGCTKEQQQIVKLLKKTEHLEATIMAFVTKLGLSGRRL